MLKRAILYTTQLNSCFAKYSDDPENIFFQQNYLSLSEKIHDSAWEKQQFVSIDKSENIIGYLSADIAQKPNYINNLAIIRYLKEPKYNVMFSKDLAEFFEFLFFSQKYRKVNFGVSVASPNRKFYRKYVDKYGGRIVGLNKEHFQMVDGTITDYETYEIMNHSFCEKYQKFHPKRYKYCVEKYLLKYIKDSL